MRFSPVVLSVFLLVASTCNRAKEEAIFVPIKIMQGRMPITHGGSYYNLYATQAYSHGLEKAKPAFKNIPPGFENAHLGVIHHDYRQLRFQEYKRGRLDAALFRETFNGGEADSLSDHWSEVPLTVSTHFLVDTTRREQPRVIVDTNCNHDFGDDEIRLLLVLNEGSNVRTDSSLSRFDTFYEALVDGEITKIPFRFRLWEEVVFVSPSGADPFNPDNLRAVRMLSGRNETFATAVFKDKTLLFPNHRSRFTDSELVPMDAPDDTITHIHPGNSFVRGNYVTIGKDYFRYEGIDLSRMRLELTHIRDTTGFRTAQVGFMAPEFTGTDFMTQKSVNSSSLRGKFVFLDFWGSWCGPCRAEYKYHLRAHASIDTSKVAFVGIAFDNADSLRSYLTVKQMPWVNIHQTDEFGIIKNFHVNSYPTSFILDPTGRVTHKKIWAIGLGDTLNALVKRWPWPAPASVTSETSTR